LLVFYQLFDHFYYKCVASPIIEGLENESKTYQPYNLNDPNNALILAQQNAGNIEVLKGRIDSLDNIKERVDNIQQSMDSMQVQIDGLVQQQADYAQELAGSEPPTVTGTEPESLDEEEE
jgi:hypothetical protein